MKKVFSRILIFILGFGFVFGTCGVTPVYAADSYSTFGGNVIDCSAYEKRPDGSDWKEGGVICILKLVLNIMTYGIGVLAVVGIVLSGIQYITSQGDSGKMAKAKNRIIQVVIGLVIYAVLYAALYFLVPGFNTDFLNGNGGGSSGGGGNSAPPEGAKTETKYTASQIKSNTKSNGPGEYTISYTLGGVSYSVNVSDQSNVRCQSIGGSSYLQITSVRGGRDERKITMQSQYECETALTYIKSITGIKD